MHCLQKQSDYFSNDPRIPCKPYGGWTPTCCASPCWVTNKIVLYNLTLFTLREFGKLHIKHEIRHILLAPYRYATN